MTLAELQGVLEHAANALLNQLGHSNGFTTLGDSALAEASLVMHIAAAFARRETTVWAESPFQTTSALPIFTSHSHAFGHEPNA